MVIFTKDRTVLLQCRVRFWRCARAAGIVLALQLCKATSVSYWWKVETKWRTTPIRSCMKAKSPATCLRALRMVA